MTVPRVNGELRAVEHLPGPARAQPDEAAERTQVAVMNRGVESRVKNLVEISLHPIGVPLGEREGKKMYDCRTARERLGDA